MIGSSKYVLTLDYTIKMLNIHERYKCGMPVIIEGETGVGKTALIEMLSKLWNQSLLMEWKRKSSGILDAIKELKSESKTDLTQVNTMSSKVVVFIYYVNLYFVATIMYLCTLLAVASIGKYS